ncbi:MAG: winged helix-turn-helix domain-containing protein [Anaerolineaceae bacterium]|nr:winged helix-turn-helix domain-containing protein [Anaerolineaceae bacterium]
MSKKCNKIRRKYGDSSEYDELSETKKNILRQIRSDNHISAALIAEKFSLSSRAVEKNIKQLREDGFLLRKGSARGGYWLVLK